MEEGKQNLKDVQAGDLQTDNDNFYAVHFARCSL